MPAAHAAVTQAEGSVELTLSGDTPDQVAAIQSWSEHFNTRVGAGQCLQVLEPEADTVPEGSEE